MATTLAPPKTPVEQHPRLTYRPAPEPLWKNLLPRFALVLLLLAAVVLGMAQFATPGVTPATAPATQFSADRAFRAVSVIAQAPHPMGTPAHAAVERYLVSQLAALGLQPRVSSMTATAGFSAGVIWAGNARHIVARIPGTANTGALLLGAHYDSVPTSGGAADCTACVASLLETVRALKAGPALRNDVIVLLADAEEHDTLGAKGFMDQHPWAKDIRFALNLDSMGNHGPSTAYFANTGNERVMSDYFNVAPHPLSYSFLVDPFTRINFGMDLKNYIRDGALGIDAANFQNPQAYHTRLDSPANLDRGTLQHEGSNFLALAQHFGNLDLRTVSHDGDAVFFNVTGDRGIVYPVSWALPLAVLAVLLFVAVLVVGFRRSRLTVGGLLGAFALFVGATFLSTIAIALAWLAIKGVTPDYQVFLQDGPYSNDLHLIAFAALALAVVAAIYAGARRRVGAYDLALGSLGLCVVLTLALSAFLPGMSYLLTWPVLVATLGLGVALGAPRLASNPWMRAALLAISGVVTLVLLTPIVYFLFELTGRMQLISGLPLVAVAFVPAILLLTVFLPHLEFLGGSRRWLVPAIALVVSLGFIAGARATSGFDSVHPRPDSVAYVLDANTGKALWVSVGSQTDNWTKEFFPHGSIATTFVPMPSEQGDLRFPALKTKAPDAGLPAPRLNVLSDRTSGNERWLDLQVSSPRGAQNVEVIVRTAGRIAAASVDGRAVDIGSTAASPGELRLEYYGLPATGARVTLHMTPGRNVGVTITDRSNGLPQIPGFTVPTRPANTMPAMFEMRDPTIVTKSFTVKT